MPLIVSSTVAAICGAWFAWRKRNARNEHIFFLADVRESDLDTALAAADIVNEVECNLQTLGAQFDRLDFHMCFSAQDALFNIVRVDGRHFEVAFYFDPCEDSELSKHVRDFFAGCGISASQDSRSRVSRTIELHVIHYPLGTSAHDAAAICGELLRTEFQIADSDIITIRHSRKRAASTP